MVERCTEYKPRRSRKGFDPEDILDKEFGRLTPRRYLGRKRFHRRYTYLYECECACGNVVEMPRVNIVTHHTESCGCLMHAKGAGSKSWTGYGEISGVLWAHIRIHARNRELDFTVTLKDAWELFLAQGQRCALTGWALSMETPKGAKHRRTASLDRIDSSKGYVHGNIQWVHKDLNLMKRDLSQDRFIEVCRAVALQCGVGSTREASEPSHAP